MTEQNAPKGEPYGLAVACLHECTTPPACVVIHPDHVLWPCTSDDLSADTFQLLDQASAVLSALRARQVRVVLLVSAGSAKKVQECLQQANLTSQFAAVVEYAVQEQQQLQQQQPQSEAPQQRPQRSKSSWMAAADSLKAQMGCPWQQMLLFSADPLAVREASRLGMAAAKVVSATGLDVASLQAGLDIYSSKLESDRGY